MRKVGPDSKMTSIKVRHILLFVFAAVGLTLLACGSEEEPDFAPAPAATRSPVPTPIPPPAAPAPAHRPQEAAVTSKQYSAPPPMSIDPSKKYTATFELTKGGTFVVELFPQEAPNTVNSFVFLAREGYYNGVTFHRVIPGFMAQGGDPTATGTGGPGYNFGSELSPDRRHDGPGVLSMANSGGLNTNGSQFFITFVATPGLDGYNADGSLKDCATRGVSCHTVFGKIGEGLNVALGITPRDPSTARTPGDAIKTITIEEGG